MTTSARLRTSTGMCRCRRSGSASTVVRGGGSGGGGRVFGFHGSLFRGEGRVGSGSSTSRVPARFTWRRRQAARCSGEPARAACGESSRVQVRRKASAAASPKRTPPLAFNASATQLRMTTGRCIQESVCSRAEGLEHVLRRRGRRTAAPPKCGAHCAMTLSYQRGPALSSSSPRRPCATGRRCRPASASTSVSSHSATSLSASGRAASGRHFAQAAAHRQPVQPVDRPDHAARAHDAARRLEQPLACGDRLQRHARQQPLEPGQAGRAGQAGGVLAQAGAIGRVRGLDRPGARGAPAACAARAAPAEAACSSPAPCTRASRSAATFSGSCAA